MPHLFGRTIHRSLVWLSCQPKPGSKEVNKAELGPVDSPTARIQGTQSWSAQRGAVMAEVGGQGGAVAAGWDAVASVKVVVVAAAVTANVAEVMAECKRNHMETHSHIQGRCY